MNKATICYFAGTHGEWGGASRVLFTTLRRLDRNRFRPIVLLSAEGPAQQLLSALGIEHQVWGPMTEMHSPWSYARALLRSWRWFRRQGVDLVHMNRANDWRPAEHLAARLAGIPMVTHFHTVNLDRTPATRLNTAIVAVSDYVAAHSDSLGVPMRVIHNAVELERFAAGRDIRGELGIGADELLVTYAGQVRRIKGVPDFVAMACRINAERVRFLVVGNCRKGPGIEDGYTEQELRQLIAADPRIHFGGYRGDMPDIYQSSDIIVAPSRWQEPFGLILIEAAAARRPVVATRVGGMPEVLENGQTGLLVEPGNVAALGEAVQSLVDDPQLRERLSQAAYQRVRAEFTDKPVRMLEALYDDLLAGRKLG